MLRATVWKPDTCRCELAYEWDDETSEDERVHTPILDLEAWHQTNGYGPDIVKAHRGRPAHNRECAAHRGLSGLVLHDHVHNENRSKNLVHGYLQRHPRHGSYYQDSGGETTRDLRPGVEYVWGFAGDPATRTLDIEVRGAELSVKDRKEIGALALVPVRHVKHSAATALGTHKREG